MRLVGGSFQPYPLPDQPALDLQDQRSVVATCALPRSRQLLLDHTGEAFQRLGAGEQPAVDEEGRGTGDARARALLDVLLHGGLVSPAADALLEVRKVQPHFLGRGLELLRAGLWGMGEECIPGANIARILPSEYIRGNHCFSKKTKRRHGESPSIPHYQRR